MTRFALICLVVTSLVATLMIVGCGGAPKQGVPLDPETVGTSPGVSGEVAAPDGPTAPPASVPATPATPAPTAPRAPRNAQDALAVAAGLDSSLVRQIKVWDAEIEAGLVRQAQIRAQGRAAMEADIKRLEARRAAKNATLVDLYLLGRMQGKLDRVDLARACFREALARDPDFLFAHEGLALCVSEPGEPGGAKAMRAHLDHAFDVWRDFPRGLLVLGQIQLTERNPRGALETLGRIPRDHPAYESALVGICDCHMALQQPDAAIMKLRAALAKHPGRIEWQVNLARAEIVTGKRDAAEATLRKVLANEPQHPVACLYMGRLLTRRGDLQGAWKLYVEVAGNRANPRSVRQEALRQKRLLEERRPNQAATFQELVAVLDKDPDPKRRRSVAQGFENMLAEAEARGEPTQIKDPALTRIFLNKLSVKREPDEGVRVAAVRVVARQRSLSDIPVLADLLDPKNEPSKLVRGTAAAQLGKVPMSHAPVGRLILALEDPETYVFQQARAALRTITGERLRTDLRGDLKPEERAQVAAAWQAWYGKRQAGRSTGTVFPPERG